MGLKVPPPRDLRRLRAVRDTGPGIPEHAVPTLFRPFRQVPPNQHIHPHGKGIKKGGGGRPAWPLRLGFPRYAVRFPFFGWCRCRGSTSPSSRILASLLFFPLLPCRCLQRKGKRSRKKFSATRIGLSKTVVAICGHSPRHDPSGPPMAPPPYQPPHKPPAPGHTHIPPSLA